MPGTTAEMSCGTADGVYSTTDFGIEVGETQLDSIWQRLRAIQPSGPLVNSEFYPGWLTNWQEDNQRRDADRAVNVLKYFSFFLFTNLHTKFVVFSERC